MPFRLPEFIGVGPGHAGTTWLHWMLRERVCLPRPNKETHFFDFNYHKGIDWYAARFRHATGDRPVGEICPYFPSTDASNRIAEHIPRCKIICTLRDPVERSYSSYKHALYSGLTRSSFERAIEELPWLTNEGRYGRHVGRWFKTFGRDRVLVVFFEDLRDRPQALIDEVCDFINVRRIDVRSVVLPARAINAHPLRPRNASVARKARRAINWLKDRRLEWVVEGLGRTGLWNLCFSGKFSPVAPDTEKRLRERFMPEVEALEELLGRKLPAWKVSRRDGG
jgi:hypothetical protein